MNAVLQQKGALPHDIHCSAWPDELFGVHLQVKCLAWGMKGASILMSYAHKINNDWLWLLPMTSARWKYLVQGTMPPTPNDGPVAGRA